MFKIRNIDSFKPGEFEKVGILKGKRWYFNSEKGKKCLFKPKRRLFKNEVSKKELPQIGKIFCANHYGEFVGSWLANRADIQVCKVELAHLSKYYENRHKEKNYGTPEEKDGCISYSKLEKDDTLEAGMITINRFKDRYEEIFKRITKDDIGNINDNIELILAAAIARVVDFYKITGNCGEEYIQRKVKQVRKKIIEMVVFDCLYGNNDRHDENWSIHIKTSGDIDLYPLYDNEKVLGLYENYKFIKSALENGDIEHLEEEKFCSRMKVPGELKKNSTYKEMLEYLMSRYSNETREILEKHLNKNTVEDVRNCLKNCEGLPIEYVDFGTQMYKYRSIYAKRLIEHDKNKEDRII